MKTKLIKPSDFEAIILRIGWDALLDRLIDDLADAFRNLDTQNVDIPTRAGISYANPDLGLLEWMPANGGCGQASLKIVGYHPTNPLARKLPTILSSICMFDTDTGHLQAMLDGTFPTALRTGAMSAIATRALCSPYGDLTLGLIGTGAQAVTQCHAISRLLPISKIVCYDHDEICLQSFSERLSFLDIPIETKSKPSLLDLLETSDILCTCSSESPGKGPLFADFSNKAGLHINAVGSDFPGKFELPIELLKRSSVFPDFLEQALVEGECQQLDASDITADLAGVLRSPALYQKLQSQLTVFDSTGHAYADYITAKLFLSIAQEMDLGIDVEIECMPTDPKDPYSFLSKPITSRLVQSDPQVAETKR